MRPPWRRSDDGHVDQVPEGGQLLSVRDAIVHRGDRTVLDAVDLDVRAGELVAIVGPNGAGKSTLLAVAAGDEAPASGTVALHGAPLASWSDVDRARRRAVLPQRSTVGFPFTVEQVVRMGRAPWAGSALEAADDEVVAAAMATAEVTHLRRRSVLRLSGGEAARAALARLLAQTAQLLLLDEPTAALDVHHEEATLRAVRSRVRLGAGAAVVLHGLDLAAAHADRVVLLDAGRVAACGPPAEVLRGELLSAVYRHPIDVHPHPTTGAPLVLPHRSTQEDPLPCPHPVR